MKTNGRPPRETGGGSKNIAVLRDRGLQPEIIKRGGGQTPRSPGQRERGSGCTQVHQARDRIERLQPSRVSSSQERSFLCRQIVKMRSRSSSDNSFHAVLMEKIGPAVPVNPARVRPLTSRATCFSQSPTAGTSTRDAPPGSVPEVG